MSPIGIFFVTLRIMAYLMAFILFGYLLCRFKLLRAKGQKLLSDLVVTVFIFVLVFNSFYFYFSLDRLRESIQFILLYLAGTVLMQVLGYGLGKKFGLQSGQLAFLLAGCFLINLGYIGMPVMQALPFGEMALLFIGMGVIATNLLLGFFLEAFIRMFTKAEGATEKRKAWKVLLSPPIMGFLCGLAVYLFRVPVPSFVHQGLFFAGRMTAPLAMVVIGCRLSACNAKEIFGDKKLYLICLARLLVLPLIVFMLAYQVSRDATMLMTLAVASACPPLAVLPIYASSYGSAGQWCTKYVFLGTMMSALTLPLIVLLVGRFLSV